MSEIREENQMEVSDIASDWDIVQSASLVTLEDSNAENGQTQKIEENMNNGNRIQDVKYADLSDSLQVIPSFEEADKVDDALQDVDCQSNSSSDVDIIDEMADDTPSNLTIPSLDLSLSSLESQLSASVVETTETEDVIQPRVNNQPTWLERYGRLVRNRQIRESVCVGAVAFSLISFLLFISPAAETYEKMKEQVSALQAENIELKSKVLSKLEDDKVFATLDEQVRGLKDENTKLSGSMQTLIHQLEEQTAIFKKEYEMRERDPYKEVIDKLKEQVNILQIDNDELQKQLFRMRYGIYSPNPQDGKVDKTVGGQDESKHQVVNDDKNENASEILSKEEKQELRKEILSEMAKLKNWEESVQNIMKILGNQQGESMEKDKTKSDKVSADGATVEEEGSFKSKKVNKKEKKASDWTWKDLKKNFKGTLDSTLDSLPTINVPDLLSKYGIVDKKKMEGVFESVGHYFKKAQEKTKKILSYDKEVKNDFWEFLGGLRKKWHIVKEEFFETNFPDAGKNRKPDSAARYPENYHESDVSNKKQKKYKNQHSFGSTLNEKQAPHVAPNAEEHKSPVTSVDSEKNPDVTDSQEESDPNSWVFERAAQRSQIRDSEHDISTNWFLRKRKDVDIEDVLSKFNAKFLSNFPTSDKIDPFEEETE